jgi:hypothetical protein
VRSAALAMRKDDASFDLMFLDEAGCWRREPLSTYWDRPFERVPPVRTFPAVRDGVNFRATGSATNGRHVGVSRWGWLAGGLSRVIDGPSRRGSP